MAFPVGNETPPLPTDRLLTKAELGEGALSVGEMEDAGRLPGADVRFSD